MNFLKSNFWEINRSSSLQIFGAILSALHILNRFYWKGASTLLQSESAKPLLCWNFHPTCLDSKSLLSTIGTDAIFKLYLACGVLALLFFLVRRFVRASWTFLLLTNILSLFFYFQDASLASDIQSLLIFLNWGFLFCYNKSSLIRFGVIAFYLVSGYRELSPEWLTGAALHEYLNFPYKVLEWVAGMSITIQWTLPFLLISPFGQRLAFGVIGMAAFHFAHFYFQHDFASVAHLSMIFYFTYDFFERRRLERESMYQSYAHPEPSKLWWPAAAGFYILAQTSWFSTHTPFEMLKITGPHAAAECEHVLFARYKNKVDVIPDLSPKDFNPQFKCLPIVAFQSAKSFCEGQKSNPDFEALQSFFIHKKFGEAKYSTLFSSDNLCSEQVTFSSLRGAK